MVPSPLNKSVRCRDGSSLIRLKSQGQVRLPLSHSNMIPCTAEWIRDVFNRKLEREAWTTARVCEVAAVQARRHYDLE
jgi:hypothetical protein